MRRLAFVLASLAIAVFGLTSCGGGNGLDVTLVEWSVQPASGSVASGELTFSAQNNGSVNHELVIIRTDSAADLPTTEDGRVDEAALGDDLIARTSALPSGESGSVSAQLEPGNYALICNLVEPDGSAHYDNGMFTDLTVEG
ncbi:MAG: hypothetical protein R3343_05360 [Nitriliruptorales bacterium]|nr:hypothetical protein [Nitriliruptorales bacterium]